ncbi:hypothetical protein N9B67_02390 [Algibacter sp.]|nr:hypothetical protein [Algibacter sp.]
MSPTATIERRVVVESCALKMSGLSKMKLSARMIWCLKKRKKSIGVICEVKEERIVNGLGNVILDTKIIKMNMSNEAISPTLD